jgi:hypothetical protein
MNIKTTDAITIQAFLNALGNLDSSLDESLKQDINNIGQTLANGDTICAAQCMRNLVLKDENLGKAYRAQRQTLNKDYQIQDRSKAGEPEDDDQSIHISTHDNKLPRIISLFQETDPQSAVKKQIQSGGFDSIKLFALQVVRRNNP